MWKQNSVESIKNQILATKWSNNKTNETFLIQNPTVVSDPVPVVRCSSVHGRPVHWAFVSSERQHTDVRPHSVHATHSGTATVHLHGKQNLNKIRISKLSQSLIRQRKSSNEVLNWNLITTFTLVTRALLENFFSCGFTSMSTYIASSSLAENSQADVRIYNRRSIGKHLLTFQVRNHIHCGLLQDVRQSFTSCRCTKSRRVHWRNWRDRNGQGVLTANDCASADVKTTVCVASTMADRTETNCMGKAESMHCWRDLRCPIHWDEWKRPSLVCPVFQWPNIESLVPSSLTWW